MKAYLSCCWALFLLSSGSIGWPRTHSKHSSPSTSSRWYALVLYCCMVSLYPSVNYSFFVQFLVVLCPFELFLILNIASCKVHIQNLVGVPWLRDCCFSGRRIVAGNAVSAFRAISVSVFQSSWVSFCHQLRQCLTCGLQRKFAAFWLVQYASFLPFLDYVETAAFASGSA